MADTMMEMREGVVVRLANPSQNLSLEVASAETVLEADDNQTLVMRPASGDLRIVEGTGGVTAVALQLRMYYYRPDGAPVDVAWKVVGSGPNPVTGADFAGGVLPSGTVRMNRAAEEENLIRFGILADTLGEASEGFRILLSGPPELDFLDPDLYVIANDDVI